jgi:hypothetical protein
MLDDDLITTTTTEFFLFFPFSLCLSFPPSVPSGRTGGEAARDIRVTDRNRSLSQGDLGPALSHFWRSPALPRTLPPLRAWRLSGIGRMGAPSVQGPLETRRFKAIRNGNTWQMWRAELGLLGLLGYVLRELSFANVTTQVQHRATGCVWTKQRTRQPSSRPPSFLYPFPWQPACAHGLFLKLWRCAEKRR